MTLQLKCVIFENFLIIMNYSTAMRILYQTIIVGKLNVLIFCIKFLWVFWITHCIVCFRVKGNVFKFNRKCINNFLPRHYTFFFQCINSLVLPYMKRNMNIHTARKKVVNNSLFVIYNMATLTNKIKTYIKQNSYKTI